MNQILDILGATVIGGFILLMISSSNIRISDFSDEILLSTVTEMDAVESLEIIDFDIYKIGYGVSNNIKIVHADSNQITFYTDITSPSHPEGDGSLDSVEYYIDMGSPLDLTNNPNDYPLFRIVNNTKKNQVGRVTQFTLSYYDSLGNEMSYASLTSQSERNKIRTLNVFVEYQASIALDSNYKTIVWEKNIRPRNLN